MSSHRSPRKFAIPSRLGQFTSLFFFLILLILVPPLLPSGPVFRLVTPLVFSAVLLSAVVVVADRRKAMILVVILVLPALALQWLAAARGETRLLEILDSVAAIVFLVYVTVLILRHVLSAPVVDAEIVLAALCAYLLFGVTWGEAYQLLAIADPAALSVPAQLAGGLTEGGAAERIYTYFSFVTLTTLGYGDITPVSSAARSLAITEAILGQLYLVTAIARLVATAVRSGEDAQLVVDEAGSVVEDRWD